MNQTKKAKPGRKGGAVTPPMQDCLEAILDLERRGQPARVRDLAEALGVHKSTVTATLKHLAREGLVRYSPYELAVLEPAGRAVAERVTGGHAVFSRFLSGVLLLEQGPAETDACRLEHAAAPETIERLRLFAQFLEQRPAASRPLTRAFSDYLRKTDGGAP